MSKGKLLASLLFCFFVTDILADDEVHQSLVPQAVRDAFSAEFPRAQAVRFELDSEDGVKTYEVKFREGRRKMKAEYTPEGKRLSLKGKGEDEDDDD